MKNIINIKNDIYTVKSYLINSFYNDSDIKYTIKKINKNTNVNKDTVKLVIDMLKRKKLIDNKYEFRLTLDAVEFLESSIINLRGQKLSAISIYIACGSLIISVIVNSDKFSLLFRILLLIYIIILYKYSDNI